MTYDPEIHHRRSIRLPAYDYSRWGAYYVTVCVHKKRCLFGEVVNERMRRNDAGQLVHEAWAGLGDIFPGVHVDTFIVMPNHLHGILVLPGDDKGRLYLESEEGERKEDDEEGSTSPALGKIIKEFKTYVIREYGKGVREQGWRRYEGKLWQRNYFEHIIRNERERNAIREYIRMNPMRWGKKRDQSGPPWEENV